MGGAGRLDHQAAAVAHVGQVAKQSQAFNKGLALRPAALEVKAEHRASAARQQPLRQRMAAVALQQRVAHPSHQRLLVEEFHHPNGVAHMARHAQRQGFNTLQDQPGRVRAQAGAKVAQALAPGPQQEGAHGRLLGEDHVVKTFIGRTELGETVRSAPVKRAAVHHHAANHRAVAAQKLGGRVVDQVGPVIKRLHQPGRSQGGVHQQGHARLVCNSRHGGDVEHIQTRVAHGLAKKKFGVGAYGGAPAIDIAGFDKGGLDAKAAQGVVQQVLRAAVERRGGDDVRARAHQRGHTQVQRRLPAGSGDGANAAFKRRHPLLQHRVGGVADARVDMASTLQVEQRGRVFARLEHKRSTQVDRYGARASGRVGCGAGMQGERVKTRIRVTRHRVIALSLEEFVG